MLEPTTLPHLDALGRKHGTDKSSLHHDYLNFYERFVGALRDQPIRMLEIGILRGESLKMWQEYFRNGHIVGIDINPNTKIYSTPRITIEIADQSSVIDLVRVGTTYGPFDIILDDGSHSWRDQITALSYLYPMLKLGGFFIVEDLDTSFGGLAENYRGNAKISTFEYLVKLQRYLVADQFLDINAEQDPFIRSYARETELIAFHRRSALLRRRPHPASSGGSVFQPPSLLDIETYDLEKLGLKASITVHLSYVGDVTVADRLVGGVRGSRHRIQAFALDFPEETPGELSYRALLEDGSWTEWVTDGKFAGKPGSSQPLRGFGLKLDGLLARKFECSCIGAFTGEPDLITVEGNGDCYSRGGGELEAMQITLRPRSQA